MKRRLSVLLFAAIPAVAQAGVTVVAGGGTGGDDSPAATAKLVAPFGVDFAPDGTLYFVEMAKGERLRKVDSRGIVTTVAGTGEKGASGDGGPGPKATFNGMHSLAVGADGVVYVADTWNNCVRTFDPKTGRVSRFAGTGQKGFSGDGGPSEKATFGGVFCVAFDTKKRNLLLTDLDNRRIRKIDLATGTVTTVAGNGKKGFPTDGQSATTSPLTDPRAAVYDDRGRVYVLERGGSALRLIDEAGGIRTLVSTGLNGPKHHCPDLHAGPDAVLIADTENHRVVRWTGKSLEVVAGTGKKGSKVVADDPMQTEFFQPHGVTVHPRTGDIYICDSGNNRILKVSR